MTYPSTRTVPSELGSETSRKDRGGNLTERSWAGHDIVVVVVVLKLDPG